MEKLINNNIGGIRPELNSFERMNKDTLRKKSSDRMLKHLLKTMDSGYDLYHEITSIPRYDNSEDISDAVVYVLRALIKTSPNEDEVREMLENCSSEWKHELSKRLFEFTSLASGLVELTKLERDIQNYG